MCGEARRIADVAFIAPMCDGACRPCPAVLIDDFLPRYDVAEYHELRVPASGARTYAALWEADLAASIVVKALFAVRLIPSIVTDRAAARRLVQPIGLRQILEHGFCLLGETPGREVVLGVTGRFWQPTGNIAPTDPTRFRDPLSAGAARAAWNFAVAERTDGTSLLTTETRILCADGQARRSFRRYWRVVGPFSGLIRRRMLESVRRSAGSIDR